jgi:lipopolysaccharide export system protein LptA
MLAAGIPARAQSPPASAPIEITGATYVEYDDATGVVRAVGAPAVVSRGRTTLRAPKLRYDQRSRVITAEGGVDLADPDLVVRAQSAELRLTDDRIHAQGDVRVRSVRGAQSTTLAAPEVEGSLRTRRFAATDGVTVTRGEWTLTGRRVDYDDATRVALVTGDPVARLKEATMTAQVITLFLDDEMARAEGSVRLRRGDLTGTAPRADVHGRDNLAVLSGGARVDRGPDRVVADVIEIDLEGTRMTARGTSQIVVVPTPSP